MELTASFIVLLPQFADVLTTGCTTILAQQSHIGYSPVLDSVCS